MYVLEMSTNCDGYPHHMIISCASYTFTNDCVTGSYIGACSLYSYVLATMA